MVESNSPSTTVLFPFLPYKGWQAMQCYGDKPTRYTCSRAVPTSFMFLPWKEWTKTRTANMQAASRACCLREGTGTIAYRAIDPRIQRCNTKLVSTAGLLSQKRQEAQRRQSNVLNYSITQNQNKRQLRRCTRRSLATSMTFSAQPKKCPLPATTRPLRVQQWVTLTGERTGS